MAGSGALDNDPSGIIPIVIIGGPTCSGKSSLAIELAGLFNAEIISADSRQIYRQLKIGTDRMDEEEWQGIRHHLMGTVDLGQRFTVFDFVRDAEKIIDDLHARRKRIIVCGGTGLYLRALTEGIFELPDDDLKYRNELLDLVATHGVDRLHNKLREVDPEAAAELHPHNVVRVIRAIELFRITGLTRTEQAGLPTTRNERFRFLYIVLMPERSELYRRIDNRVKIMVNNGLFEETEKIYRSEQQAALRQSKVVGYDELVRYFDGTLSRSEAISLIMQNTRRYAKRQYTWFRAVKSAQTFGYFGNQARPECIKLIEPFWAAID